MTDGPPAAFPRGDGPRSRNATASRQALLAAARALFGQRGFDGTTTRDIGELAGVDPALIARYFGGKADLYVAALVAEAQGSEPPSPFQDLEQMATALLTLTDEQGLGPVTQALIRWGTDHDIGTAARAHMVRRLVAPLTEVLTRREVDQPALRAQLIVSALLGINLGRALGWFDDLAGEPRERLVGLIVATLDPGSVP